MRYPARGGRAAQLPLPKTPKERAAFGARLAPIMRKESRLLLVADDWPFYTQEEMDQLSAIRSAAGETRRLMDAPGHLLRKPEHSLFIHLASLILGFPSRWSFYVYGLSSGFTLYFWEGDLLDAWSSKGLVSELRELLA